MYRNDYEKAVALKAKIEVNEQTMGQGQAFARAASDVGVDIEQADILLAALKRGNLKPNEGREPQPKPKNEPPAPTFKVNAWWKD